MSNCPPSRTARLAEPFHPDELVALRPTAWDDGPTVWDDGPTTWDDGPTTWDEEM